MTFNKEARDRYLQFAEDPVARWRGNFRDLAASITRMATLGPTGRIDDETVAYETSRLRSHWSGDKQVGDGLDVLLSSD